MNFLADENVSGILVQKLRENHHDVLWMKQFDEVRCDGPLPDGFDGSRVWFQTKSFPSPCMQRYTITKEGRLVDSLGNDIEPDGYIIFYGRDESDMDRRDSWREYRARFSEGVLDEIVRVETDDHDRTWYGLASFRWFEAPTYLFGDPDEDDSDDPAG